MLQKELERWRCWRMIPWTLRRQGPLMVRAVGPPPAAPAAPPGGTANQMQHHSTCCVNRTQWPKSLTLIGVSAAKSTTESVGQLCVFGAQVFCEKLRVSERHISWWGNLILDFGLWGHILPGHECISGTKGQPNGNRNWAACQLASEHINCGQEELTNQT